MGFLIMGVIGYVVKLSKCIGPKRKKTCGEERTGKDWRLTRV
jgi:hypothetical protein